MLVRTLRSNWAASISVIIGVKIRLGCCVGRGDLSPGNDEVKCGAHPLPPFGAG